MRERARRCALGRNGIWLTLCGRNRQPFKLKIPFQIHNVYLTLGSGLLLVLMLEEMYVTSRAFVCSS